MCQFVCGKGIPKYILDLPEEFLSTQLGQSLAPLFDTISQGSSPVNGYSFDTNNSILNREQSPGFQELISEVELAREQSAALDEKRKVLKDKLEKKERKKDRKEKKEKKHKKNSTHRNSTSNSGMSEVESSEMNGSGGVSSQQQPEIPSEMLPSEQALEDEAIEKRAEEEKKKQRDPPVVFTDIDVSQP